MASNFNQEQTNREGLTGEEDYEHLLEDYSHFAPPAEGEILQGTVLKVTNLENSRAVRVRVTDRGPTRPVRREGVIIDLSRAAARRLRFTDDGRARVRVEVVKLGRKKK